MSKRKFKLELHWQILIGVCLGILWGAFFPHTTHYISWMGDLFLRGLKMVVIPLVFSALVMGVSGIGSAANLGRIAGKTFAYYIFTTLVASVIGLCLVNWLEPGRGLDVSLHEQVEEVAVTQISLVDRLVAIVPENVVEAMAKGNMLPIIFFAILFGFFITVVEEKTRVVLTDFFNGCYQVMIKMTFFVIRLAPLGLMGVIAHLVGQQVASGNSVGTFFGSLGIYAALIAGGCLLQGLAVLPALFAVFTRKNPFKFLRQMGTALLTVFTTASSAAGLPIAMEDIHTKTGVSRKIAGFCLPLGNTVNMNGTALFECVTAIFIAQAYGIELTIAQEIIIVLTSLLAAIGCAGIPLAGLVMMAVILNAVGLPLEGVSLVLVVQTPLDMIRSAVNVWGDMTGAAIVAKSEGETLTI